MDGKVLVAIALVLVSAVAPVAAHQGHGGDSGAYAGTHVSFEASSNAVVNYTVNGKTAAESIVVQSQEKARSSGAISADASLSSTTRFQGSSVSTQTTAEAHAVVTFGSGAKMKSHDNSRGVVVVRAGGNSQYAHVDVAQGWEASDESQKRVTVSGNGTTGAWLVVGDGKVTVNEKGNVTAKLGPDARLVYRQYPQGRSDEDRKQEQLITDGVAAAEVYLTQQSKEGGKAVVDVVSYSEQTTVEVTERTKSRLVMTAESSQQQGKVILTTISKQAFQSVEDVQVKVDGNAAARASSYSALRTAATEGDTSKFLVRQQSSAEASADVLVAVSGFSTRKVTMTTGGEGGETATETSGSGPGFGALAGIAGIGAALLGLRRE